MENITVQKLPADQGMRQVISMIKSKYIAELMDGNSENCRTILSNGVYHNIKHNKPYYFSEKQVSDLQRIIVDVCASLMKVRILQEPQSEEEYPLCYGDDMVSKFKVLGKVIKLPFLFIDVIGKKKRWMTMHLTSKEDFYYNRFTDSELDLINDGIRAIALKLCSIQFEYQVPPSNQ
ncbi:MAG: hypothetical protein K2I99_07800 [Bacteroidaceae bacterium]|nr:hypothetical protein [Bacteroidaceae bacterium]